MEVLYGTRGSVSVNTLGTNGSVLPAPPEPSTPSSRLCSPTSPLLKTMYLEHSIYWLIDGAGLVEKGEVAERGEEWGGLEG